MPEPILHIADGAGQPICGEDIEGRPGHAIASDATDLADCIDACEQCAAMLERFEAEQDDLLGYYPHTDDDTHMADWLSESHAATRDY